MIVGQSFLVGSRDIDATATSEEGCSQLRVLAVFVSPDWWQQRFEQHVPWPDFGGVRVL